MGEGTRYLDDARLGSLLADLTEPQAEAVRHPDGPLLLLAGAGSGKTRVITRRAAYLACTVTAPRNVLAITFTNKAANEMRARIVALGVSGDLTACTFHAFCARQLRIHHERIGLPGDFTVFDDSDQRRVMKEAIEHCGLAPENWTPARLTALISRAKNDMVTADGLAGQPADWSQRSISHIYEAYEAVLARQHGLDFDDLLLRFALALRSDEELCRLIERRYTHVLIDEYQDTNSAQYAIARLITRQRHNLCATGDPDQSIYGWRGADIRNILRFEEDFPETRVVRLERNYRSTKRILSAASAVIEHNRSRKKKTLWTENDEGKAVRVVEAETAEAEARFLADEIRARRDGGEDLGRFAVFYRINALSRAIEEALIQAGIPYQVARGTEFYNRKEIKDVLAYLRVLVNRFDEVSLTRIINTPARGIGATTVDRLVEGARGAGRSLLEVILDPAAVQSLGKAARTRVALFAETMGAMTPLVEAAPRHAVEQVLALSGLQAALNALAEHDPGPRDNVNELINAAAVFEAEHAHSTLIDWLEHTSLLSDVDGVEDDGGRVTLMTLHAAKGLEFPVCTIIGLEEGLLPFQRGADEAARDDEEERRLLFVGMTRAREELTLSMAQYRMLRGVAERKMRSRFLDELPVAEIQRLDASSGSADSESRLRREPGLPPDIEQWEPGVLVRHAEYGLGKIVWIQPNGAQTRLSCRFQQGGERTFILRFSGLERVDYHEIGDD